MKSRQDSAVQANYLRRTGKVTPDMYILGKALGGGVFPISCVLADSEVLSVFNAELPRFDIRRNPLARAVSEAALDVMIDENLIEKIT